MTVKEKFLIHQVHPAKLATDIGAANLSPVAAPARDRAPYTLHPAAHWVCCGYPFRAHLDSYKNSRLGAYLVRYMTPLAQAARLAGDLITVGAAWYQSFAGILFGLAVIAAAWSYGWVLRLRE